VTAVSDGLAALDAALAAPPDLILGDLFARIAPHFGLDAYFNYLIDESGEGLRLGSCAGVSEATARQMHRLDFGQAICGSVALQRRPIAASSIQQSDAPMEQLARGLGPRAYACNPLIAGERLLGTLSFSTRGRDEFADEELEFLRTISHYVAFAHERLRLIEQLREADRRKDEFLATLAHELRNPLAPIRNALHLMRSPDGDARVVEAERAMAERQVVHLARLIDDLMDVARISRGKIELHKGPVDLARVVAQAVETAGPLLHERRHRLALALPAGPIRLEADPTRLEQVLWNLLNNAAKYTEPGGEIRLSVEPEADRSGVVMTVRDSGIGIRPEMLPRVFEMFVQVGEHHGHAQGGLGIGLSLVRTLVEMHGGTIAARSEGPGQRVRRPPARPARRLRGRPARRARPAGRRPAADPQDPRGRRQRRRRPEPLQAPGQALRPGGPRRP